MTDTQNKLLPGTPVEEDEIDLIQLAKELWNGRKLVLKTTLIFIVLGLLVALLSPKEYSVTSTVVPQTGSSTQSKLGGLSSLAALAGFNLNMSSGGSELSPMIYPRIVQSIPFQKALMQTKLNFKGIDHPVTYYEYFTKYAKRGALSHITGLPGMIKSLPGMLLKLFHPNETQSGEGDTTHLIRLSPKERSLANGLKNKVYANVDAKNGYITLTAIMPQALAAAQLGEKALELLQKQVIEIRIQKAKAQLDFVRGRYEAKKKIYEEIQDSLALMTDKSNNVMTQVDKTTLIRLQGDYQIALSVYNGLAGQLENAQIQVKNDTPVFSVIEPVTVPNKRFKPKRSQILIIWTFIGLIIGIGWVFGKEYFQKVKAEWNEKE